MKRRHIRLRFSWLWICAAAVLVLCGLFFLFSTYICDSIRQSEQARVEQNANQVKSILDDTWDSMFNFGMSFMYSNVAKKLESAEDTADFRSRGAYDLSSGISKQVTFEPMIADVVLYYPQSDILVGSKGVYTAHAYWTSVYGTGPDADEDHYARWYRALFSNRSSGYFATENGIFYRLSAENSNGRFLVAKISESALRERLAWINGTNSNAYAAVADQDGQILNYAGSYDLFAAAVPAALDGEDGEYLVSWRDGSAVGLKYLVVFEKSAAYRLSSTVKDISLGLLIAVFLLGVLASYLLFVRNVIPLERIAARLDNGNEQDVNAFELIDAGIDRLFEKQNEISTVARKQQILIGRTFLNELLFGEPSNQNQPETLAAIYGLTLESAQSMIVVRERSGEESGMIPDCMLSSSDDTLQAFWTERNHTDIFLFHYDPEAEGCIRNFIGRLKEQSGSAHRVICSKPTEDLACLTECWLSCIHQLGRTDLLPKRYRQSAAFHAGPRQPVLDSFQYRVADKDYDGAMDLTEDVYEQYISDADTFFFTYKCYQLIHILLPACPVSAYSELAALPQLHDKVRWIQQCNQILEHCASETRKEGEADDPDIADQVRRIIHTKYDNPMLDLRLISEEIGLSQSYISRLFKRKYGLSVFQYVNKTRIDRAKELMNTSDDNIKIIAMKVGFFADAQFIRAFKRQEGITPGQYRRSCAKETE